MHFNLVRINGNDVREWDHKRVLDKIKSCSGPDKIMIFDILNKFAVPPGYPVSLVCSTCATSRYRYSNNINFFRSMLLIQWRDQDFATGVKKQLMQTSLVTSSDTWLKLVMLKFHLLQVADVPLEQILLMLWKQMTAINLCHGLHLQHKQEAM